MEVVIRTYNPADRNSVRTISCRTSFLEFDRKMFFDDDEVLADVLTLYFTDYEPQSCFIAESGNKVIRYVSGTVNAAAMGRVVRFSSYVP